MAHIVCPTCSSKSLPPARYCQDCYTVFDGKLMRGDPAVKNRGFRGTAFLVAALAGAILWFSTLEPEPWKYEENSFSAAAAGIKRRAMTLLVAPAGTPILAADPAASQNGAGRRRAGAVRRVSSAASEWLLPDLSRSPCPHEDECTATIRFDSGETSTVTLEPAGAGLVVLKGDDDTALLLATHDRAVILEAEDEAMNLPIRRARMSQL